MKVFSFLFLIVLSSNTFASYKWELERNLKILARQVDALANQNAEFLTIPELRSSIRKLKNLKVTLLGMENRYPTRSCSEDNPNKLKTTFKSIKFWAKSIKGLELGNSEAIRYAVDWTNTYPCSYANFFMKSYFIIKRYASATNGGLEMTKQASINYANNVTPFFCGDINFKRSFWPAYKMAKYEMEMNESDAINYAKRIVERDHFSCRWDDLLFENNVDLRFVNRNQREVCITPVPVIIPVVPNIPWTPRR